VVLLDEREREVERAGDTGGGRQRTVTHEDGCRVDVYRRVSPGEPRGQIQCVVARGPSSSPAAARTDAPCTPTPPAGSPRPTAGRDRSHVVGGAGPVGHVERGRDAGDVEQFGPG
jgi:hypothetical protein